MDPLRVAAPLARLLLAASESGCDGDIHVVRVCPAQPSDRPLRSHDLGRVAAQPPVRAAQLSVAGGRLLAIGGVEHAPLGDTLLALGALDTDSQRGVLGRAECLTPIGARLVAAGATSPAAVSCALEVQLADGVHTLLRWPATRVELLRLPDKHEPPRGTCTTELAAQIEARVENRVTIDVAGAVWSALWVIASELPVPLRAQLSGSAALKLTVAGKRRVHGLLRAIDAGELGAAFRRRAFLRARVEPSYTSARCDEPRASSANEQRSGSFDSTPDALSAAALEAALRPGPCPEQYALRAVLRVLGAAIERPTHEDAYALLLRKHRQLSRNASASALLDLPEAASGEHARRALRKLAQKLHPDRFQAGDARLYAVSNVVMGALARAENTLRARAHDTGSERGARA
ncbi:MAG: hypothetical protein RLZZ450_3957 [Pseudomonadota bacterium]|jgi:hypothetical protein